MILLLLASINAALAATEVQTLTATATAAVATSARPNRWRHINPTRVPPRTLNEAKILHLDGREGMHCAGREHSAGRVAGSSFRVARAEPSWASARAERAALCTASSPTISPIDFGADPTGASDSTAAFDLAVAALLNHSGLPPMADSIVNLGGATLDLMGGEYLISRPLLIPKLVGNVRVRGGSLRASATFPADRFIIEVGEHGCNAEVPQGVCNEMVGFDNLFLDAGHRGGGILVQSTMGTTIGPSCFFTGFSTAGVRVMQGHETLVSSSWFAEYYWSDHRKGGGNSSSVGVDIHGQDNYVTDVIVFDYTHLGVSVDGAASLLQGVHTWNGGGVGIRINGSYAIQDRLLGCYLDYNTLEVVDPTQTTVEDTFFLDTNAVLVQSKRTAMQSVVFRENVYAFGQARARGVNQSIVLQGAWKSCGGVTVEDELPERLCTMSDGWACGIRQTVARRSVTVPKNSDWAILEFDKQLLLPFIDYVQGSMSVPAGSGQLPGGVGSQLPVFQINGTRVVVRLAGSKWTETVHVEVRQCGANL
jgi:hypothetical protein